MAGRFHRDNSSWPPARDLFLSSLLFCLAAAGTFAVLRAMFGERPYIGPRRMYLGPFLEFVTVLLLAPGVVSAALGLIACADPSRLGQRSIVTARILASLATVTRWAMAAGLRWIETRIPPASAQSLALFRIVFGTLLLWYFMAYPVDADMVALASPESSVHRAVLPLFASEPAAVDWIRPWLVFWTLLFIAGALTRISFAMLTAGSVAWALLYTMRAGAHSVQVLIVALLCLLPSKWGNTWSIDALLHGHRNRHHDTDTAPDRLYGYPMWMLGLVLGTSFAAAAFAKLREGGLSWILNATVRYHFLTDSEQAPVDWGVRLAQYDALAIFMSLAAVVIEALVIVGVCSTRYGHRLVTGLAALALLIGFWLFQGLFWPAWWILLLAFLPWHRLPQPAAAPELPALPARPRLAPYIAIVMLLVGQQAIASVVRIELAPFVSAFDMYSTTYAGPADYESKSDATYWLVGQLADGTREPCRVTREEADAVAAQASGEMRQILAKCFQTRTPWLRSVSVESQRRAIDWARWRLGDEVRTPMAGPITLQP